MKIAVDFDGTCVANEFPFIGHSIGSEKVLKKWVQEGHKIILFTMRSGIFLQQAIEWFKQNDIPLYGINKDPGQKHWTSSPKAFAQVYIDDCSIGCPLVYPNDGSMPYADWAKIEKMMKHILSEEWRRTPIKNAADTKETL